MKERLVHYVNCFLKMAGYVQPEEAEEMVNGLMKEPDIEMIHSLEGAMKNPNFHPQQFFLGMMHGIALTEIIKDEARWATIKDSMTETVKEMMEKKKEKKNGTN